MRAIAIDFGRWNCAGGPSIFPDIHCKRDRWLISGWRWTPIVFVKWTRKHSQEIGHGDGY